MCYTHSDQRARRFSALTQRSKEYITYSGRYETSWLPGCILEIKADDYNPSPAEQKKYKDMGYLSLTGSLLCVDKGSEWILSVARQ